jgi:hypothetical protein
MSFIRTIIGRGLVSWPCVDNVDSSSPPSSSTIPTGHPLARFSVLFLTSEIDVDIETLKVFEEVKGGRVLAVQAFIIDDQFFVCAEPIYPSRSDTDKGLPTNGLSRIL